MKQSPPLVSIGMPVYNGSLYIREAIESLLSQSHGNLEIIISDDGSSDDTLNICRSYAADDARIRLISQGQRLGMYDNFQFVLDESRGDYFMWASQDDIWDYRWVSECLEALSPEDILSVGAVCTVDESGRTIHAFPRKRFSKYAIVRSLQMMYCHRTGVLMYGVFDASKLKAIDGFGRIQRLGPTIDPLLMFNVSMAGQINTSASALLRKRVYGITYKRSKSVARLASGLRSSAAYAVSYLRLNTAWSVKVVLGLNLIPFFVAMIANEAIGTVYKRPNV